MLSFCFIALLGFCHFKTNRYKNTLQILLAIFFGFATIHTHTYFKHKNITLLQQDLKYITIQATVKQIIDKPNQNKRTLILENVTQNNKLVLNKASASTRDLTSNIAINSQITAVAYFFAPLENIATNSINMKKHAFVNNIESYGYLVKVINTTKGKSPAFFTKTRNYITNKLKENTNPTVFGFANALLTGNKNYIETTSYQNIIKAGIAHLFAISGYHISLIGAFVFFITRFLLASVPYVLHNYNVKTISACFAILVVLFYVALVSFPPSAIRAFLIFALLMVSYIFNQGLFSYKTLANVALIMLLFNPYYVYNTGFILSFTSYLAILYTLKSSLFYKINNFSYFKQNLFNSFIKWLFGLVLVSLSISLVTLVEIGLFFRQVPLYSSLTNILAIPIFSIFIMPFLFLFALFSYFDFAIHLLQIPSFALNILLNLSDFIASLPYSAINFYNLSYYFIALYIFGLGLMLVNFKYALLVVALSNIGFISFKAPNIMLDYTNQNIMIIENKTLITSSKIDNFSKSIINQSYNLQNNKLMAFKNGVYKHSIKGKTIHIANKASKGSCKNADLIILQDFIKNKCGEKTIILKNKNQGLLNIYITNKTIKASYNIENNKNKPWNK